MACGLLLRPFHQALNFLYLDGLSSIYKDEGLKGLYRGTSLALVGVSNGAIQFMGYEQLKWLCFEQKRRQYKKEGRSWTVEADKLVSLVQSVSLFQSLHIECLVKLDLYCYLRSFKTRCLGLNLPVPSSTVTHTSELPLSALALVFEFL